MTQFFQCGSKPGAGRAIAAALLLAPVAAAFAARAQSGWLLDMMGENRLTSVFHPIVECATRRVFGHECLLRGIEGAWVKDHVVNIEDGQITSWQVNLEVTLVLDDSGAPVDASSD